MEAVACPVSHTVYPFVHIFLLAIVHCNEYPVWFEAFGFCLYRQNGPSLDSLYHGYTVASDLQI